MDEVSVWIDAEQEQVWDLVSDVTHYGEWSPENISSQWSGGVAGPELGATFKGTNKHGVMRWTTNCTVIECDWPSRFGFEVAESRVHWGFRLEPEGGGTRLTQWRNRVGSPPLPIRLVEKSGLLGRDRERFLVDGMRQTIEHVKRVAEQSKT